MTRWGRAIDRSKLATDAKISGWLEPLPVLAVETGELLSAVEVSAPVVAPVSTVSPPLHAARTTSMLAVPSARMRESFIAHVVVAVGTIGRTSATRVVWYEDRMPKARTHAPLARLTHPMVKENGQLRRASWDEALDRAAAGFRRATAAKGPDSVGLFSCSKTTNEMNYVAQKFARAVIGTNNIDSCNRT